jgi:hypothetical protein
MRIPLLPCLRAFLLAFPLAAGLAAVAYPSHSARAQTGTVTCWAESCVGNVCVRVQIECPKPIVVIE